MMKAIILKNSGSVDNLIHTEIAKPEPQADEVLIKVKAISINPVDVKARQNEGVLDWLFGETRPVILGWDISGEVIALGQDVNSFQVGDEVFGMVNFPGHGKSYAEYVSATANQLALKPKAISHEQAAASTLAALTALQALRTEGNIQPNQSVLVHAGSGGVGHFAIQIAKHFGANVISTSSSKNKDFILSLGADQHIDYQSSSFENSVSEVDFVLDAMAGEVLKKSISVTKESGQIITIPSGEIDPETVELAKKKNVDLSFMLVQSNGDDMKLIAELLESMAIIPHVSTVYDFEDMDKAHLQIESGRTVGKIVVKI